MRYFFAFSFLLFFGGTSLFAKSKNKKPKAVITIPFDSAKWRTEHYIVNRDSAYADPRVALRKLMGGNKRFIESKSIKPRQDINTIKKLENGQEPFATIVGCSDSRVPNELIFGAVYNIHSGKFEFLDETLVDLPKPKTK